MLCLKVGSRCFEVAHADIQNHPGTLLHDMVTDLGQEATEGPVQLDTAATPLALPGADILTQALYRSPPTGFVDPATLCHLLATHQRPGEVYRLLESLLDFLKMPGTITQWLPPLQQISLLHAGVERLHYYPMAKAAADAILGYQPFSTSSSSSSGDSAPKLRGDASSPTMAMFSIRVRPAAGCSAFDRENVSVHAMQSQVWPPMLRRENVHDIEGSLWLGNTEPIYMQLLPPAGQQLSYWGQSVSDACALGRCIQGELVAALQQVHGDAVVKVKCWRCRGGTIGGGGLLLWVVSW